MRITPLDVRKQEFRKAVRGFDCDEVRAFLATMADEYETVLVDNKQLRERVMDQDDKITEYNGMEKTLRDTLMTAERAMQETRENATREGGLIVQEAQMKARGIMEECRLRTEELRREIQGLRKEKETYLARFKGLAEAQIQFVDSHQDDFRELDQRLVDIVDSVNAGVEDKALQVLKPALSQPNHVAAPLNIPVAPPVSEFVAMPVVSPVETVAAAPTETPTVDVWRNYDTITGKDRDREEMAPAAPEIENIEAANPEEPTLDNSTAEAEAIDPDTLTDEIAEVIRESVIPTVTETI